MAQGGPGNTFTWTKLDDNSTVSTMANVTIMVTGASDGGMYQCEVMNSAGSGLAQTTLNGKLLSYYTQYMAGENQLQFMLIKQQIQRTCSFEKNYFTLFVYVSTTSVAPYLTVFSTPPTIPSGGPGTLACVAMGFPAPQVTWYHNGSLLLSDGGVTVSGSTVGTSTVDVSSANSSNSGNYSCRVESSVQGYDVLIRSATVLVQGNNTYATLK